MEEKNLLMKAPNIQRLYESNFIKKNNDIIFLLDISESMGVGFKEDYALREILKVSFDNMNFFENLLSFLINTWIAMTESVLLDSITMFMLFLN